MERLQGSDLSKDERLKLLEATLIPLHVLDAATERGERIRRAAVEQAWNEIEASRRARR